MSNEDQILAAMLLFASSLLPNEPAVRYLKVKEIVGSKIVLCTTSLDLYLAINKDSVRVEISNILSKMLGRQVDVVTHWSEQ